MLGTSRRKLSVVIVDDDPLLLAALERFFRNGGWDVHACPHAYFAFEVVQREHVDIALVDIEMAELSGIDFLRHLRAACIDIPVMLMSENSDALAEAHTQALDVAAYLEKPLGITAEVVCLAERIVTRPSSIPYSY